MKSMAYIVNIVALGNLHRNRSKYGLYNYVDTPDLTMNELVLRVRTKLAKTGLVCVCPTGLA